MSIRAKIPVRSDVEERQRYREYKADLRRDFSRRCGYCDSLDEYFGGARGYQIDHFAPKSKFPELEIVYGNLVYSCPFCNRAKSNKWVGENSAEPHNGVIGFVDPCDNDFDNHVTRDGQGRVIAKTQLGQYMVTNLNLKLLRHQFIWQTQKLEELVQQLSALKPHIKQSSHYMELLEMFFEVTNAYFEYKHHAIEA